MRRLAVSPHLLECDWAAFELSVLRTLTRDLERATEKLDAKLTQGRIHTARITLRRWQSVCSILDNDGLYLEDYQLVKAELEKYRKSLGKLRDWEILIEMARGFQISRSTIKVWEAKRCKRHEATVKLVHASKVQQLLHNLEDLIEKPKRPGSLFKSPKHPTSSLKAAKHPTNPLNAPELPTSSLKIPKHPGTLFHASGVDHNKKSASQTQRVDLESAYGHLEPYLIRIEKVTRKTERQALLPGELHELRISIKSWRYFLTEFFGVTNLQLVRAQQVLGKIHDIDRMLEILSESDNSPLLSRQKLARINLCRDAFLAEFALVRKRLPYGLRPGIGGAFDKSS
jgi:CHAD domain-containing protein